MDATQPALDPNPDGTEDSGLLSIPSEFAAHGFALLSRQLRERRAWVGVVGQGYVGFPLAQAAAEAGFTTIGLDIDERVVHQCKAANESLNYTASASISAIGACEVALVAVPTPTRLVDGERRPDISILVAAVRDVLASWTDARERLLVIESTYGPGTTREVVGALVDNTARHPELIAVGYSPERIDPGNTHYTLRNTPKIVSGRDAAAQALVVQFYRAFVDDVVIASSLEAAEASKVLENTFRLVNIAFAHEFDDYCIGLGVDSREVVDLAASKPFGFMPFYAGPGVGGHCIAEDPYFLLERMRAAGLSSEILEAVLANHERRVYSIVARVVARLGTVPLAGARILVLGVTYKPDIGDPRRSPAEALMSLLRAAGARVDYFDPHLPTFMGESAVDFTSVQPDDYDLAILVTQHKMFDPAVIEELGWNLLDVSVPRQLGPLRHAYGLRDHAS